MSKTFTVPIILPADPTQALEAATKQYVDANAGGGAPVASQPTLRLAGLGETIATATTVAMSWGLSTESDPQGYLALSTPTRIQAVKAGYYLLTYVIRWASMIAPAVGNSEVKLNSADNVASGTRLCLGASMVGTSTAGARMVTTSKVIYMAAGDYVNIFASHSDAGTQSISAGEAATSCQVIALVGATGVQGPPGDVASSRTIATTAPLAGGGDLSANRTLSIATDGVTNTLLAPMATNTIKGNNTGSTAGPTDLTAAFVAAMLPVFGGNKGLAPASGQSGAAYLRDDGTWTSNLDAATRKAVKGVGGVTTYAPLLTDENTLINISHTATCTITMPSDATLNFPVGAEIHFFQGNTGQAVFVAGGGATLSATPGLKIRARYGACTVIKTSANNWMMFGDLAP